MRYSFHGKMRFTGQMVDGFVEADSSAEAIDRLADQGIIGVHTVRREPTQLGNHVVLANGVAMAALPPAASGVMLPKPGGSFTNYSAVTAGDPGALTSLVEKLTTLVGQVEKILSRPMPAYSPGPMRSSEGSRVKRPAGDAQNAALKAIFESNVDLRQNLAKLSSIPVAAKAVDAGPALEARSVEPRTVEKMEKLHNPRENGNGSPNLMPRPIGAVREMAIHARSA